MSGPDAAARLRQWQDAVARDPGSPAFLPLAEMYLTQGRLEVARSLCVRGLERHPEHVDAHYLLGRIHREAGDSKHAYDEWDIALRLDPLHAPARRAIALLCLEREAWVEARRHLKLALRDEGDDPRLRRAMAWAERGGRARSAGPEYWAAVAALLAGPLEAFVRETRVRLALTTDAEGRLLAQYGFSRALDVAAFASLAAGVHAASREIARMTGQPRFRQLYQGADEHQIFLGAVDTPAGELLLLTVFGVEAPLGLVRVEFEAFAGRLAGIAGWPSRASHAPGAGLEAELASGLERLFPGDRGPAPAAGR
jgi:tetratricopeptide (TPR) repeat protein